MRLTSLARRSVAVVAATALVSGGLAAGLVTPAYAAGSIDSFTPTEWDNRSTVSMTVNGSGFPVPASPVGNVTLLFTPKVKDTANEVDTFVVDADPGTTATKVTAKVPLAMAPPGLYELRVADGNGANASTPAATPFRVYGFGSANATGVAFGNDPSGSEVECGTTISCEPRALPGTTAPLDINGSNIAIGAKVRFLTGGTPDPGLTFVQNNPNNSENKLGTEDADGVDGTGYASTTLLQGNYTAKPDVSGGPGFTPGMHKLQIVNTDGLTAGATVDFAQPWFAAPSDTSKPLSPSGIGVGAKDVVVTLTGQGIRAGSKLVVESKSTSSCAGVTTGPSTVSDADEAHPGTFTKISAPVSMADCTTDDMNPRAVTIAGPDGARFSRNAIFNIVANPTFGAIDEGYEVLGQGAHVGFGTEIVKISGTGFQGQDETLPSKMVKFSFGEGVTVTTVAVTSPNSAQVKIDVADNAPVGNRVATVTNPDGGSSTKSAPTLPPGPAPLAIEAGPKVTSITPSVLDAAAGGQAIVIKGTFDTDDTYFVTVCDHLGTMTCTDSANIAESPSPVTPTDSSTLELTISTSGAKDGVRDVQVLDSEDHGRVYCTSCMSVDTLTVSPTSAPNTGDATLTFTAPGIDTVTTSSTAVLTRTTPVAGQGPIGLKSGTHLTSPAPDKAAGTFALAGAVPGKYSILVTKDPSDPNSQTWSCGGCFTVTGTPFTVTGIDRIPTDGDSSPTSTSGGQGATDLPLKITGTNFTPGMDVSIQDVTVHDVTFISPTELHLLADIASNAPVGANKPVTVKSIDGSGPSSGALTFTITGAPTPTSGLTPNALGQGAGGAGYIAANDNAPITITVKAQDLQPGAQLSLGPDIAVTEEQVTDGGTNCLVTVPIPLPPGCGPLPDTLTGKIAIAQDAVTGPRNAVITNPDGGTATIPNAFTVNQGPKITSVANPEGAPVLVPDGVAHKITILGSGFATPPADASKVLDVLPSDGVTITNVQVVDAGKITADIKVESNAARGGRVVGVTNQTDKGFGGFGPVYVATKPAAPANLKLSPGPSSLGVSWSAPNDGGAPITGYHVTIQRIGSTTVVSRDVSGAQRSTTFTGLLNGWKYVVKVTAANAAGVSPAASITGQPGLWTWISGGTSAKTVTAGDGVTIGGRLMHSSSPVPGRTVKLLIDPAVGPTFTRTATTNASGVYAYRFYPRYHFTVKPYFSGDATYRPVVGTVLKVTVPSRVTRTSPASGSRSSSLTTLTIRGTVFPNHAGTYVYLYRFTSAGKTLVNRVKLSSTSTFTFTGKPKAGTYTFRVYIPATTGNAANYSSAFTIYRT